MKEKEKMMRKECLKIGVKARERTKERRKREIIRKNEDMGKKRWKE